MPRCDRGVCYFHADRAKPDNAKLLCPEAHCTGKLLLFFLRRPLPHPHCHPDSSYPVCSTDDVSGRQQHTCKHKLLYAVGICTRRVEYDNSLVCTFIQRDIIDTCSRTGNRTDALWKLHLMHFSASHQHRIRIRQVPLSSHNFPSKSVPDRPERSDSGKYIETSHAFSFSKSFMNATELPYAFDRHRIVNACAHTADGPVSLEVHKACLFRSFVQTSHPDPCHR